MFFVKKEMLTFFWWCFLVLRNHCWFAFQGQIQDFSYEKGGWGCTTKEWRRN